MCRSCPLRCWQLTILLFQIHPSESVLCSLGANSSLHWLWFDAAGPLQSLGAPLLIDTVQVSLMCPAPTTLLSSTTTLAQLDQGLPSGSVLHKTSGTPYPDHVQYSSSHARPSDMGRNGPSPSAKLKSSRRPPTQGGDDHAGTTSAPAKATPANQGEQQADNGWGTAWTWETRAANWNNDWRAAHATNAGWWTGQWNAQWDQRQWTSRVPPPPPPPPVKRRNVTSAEHTASQQEGTEALTARAGSSQDHAMPSQQSSSTSSAAPVCTLPTVKEEQRNSPEEEPDELAADESVKADTARSLHAGAEEHRSGVALPPDYTVLTKTDPDEASPGTACASSSQLLILPSQATMNAPPSSTFTEDFTAETAPSPTQSQLQGLPLQHLPRQVKDESLESETQSSFSEAPPCMAEIADPTQMASYPQTTLPAPQVPSLTPCRLAPALTPLLMSFWRRTS